MDANCEHRETEIRRKGQHLRQQCLACGMGVGTWLPKTTKPPAGRVAFAEWDAELEAAGIRARTEQAQAEWIELSAERTRLYYAYLDGEHLPGVWANKRQRVLNRDRICQACLIRPAVQVHHLTYKHIFDEPLFELVGICRNCHRKLHPEKQNGSG